jgi:hypothetical protein
MDQQENRGEQGRDRRGDERGHAAGAGFLALHEIDVGRGGIGRHGKIRGSAQLVEIAQDEDHVGIAVLGVLGDAFHDEVGQGDGHVGVELPDGRRRGLGSICAARTCSIFSPS